MGYWRFNTRAALMFSLMGLAACGGGDGDDKTANVTPTAIGQTLTLDEDHSLALTLSGVDADGDSLSYIVVTQPLHGALRGTAPELIYVPTDNYYGSDSFTFKVNDGLENSEVASISLSINSINDVPSASDLIVVLEEDHRQAIILSGSDVDGDSLSYSVTNQPAHGRLSGTAPDIIYIPTGDFHGSDSFTYKVSDGAFNSSEAIISLTINPIDDAPVVEDLSIHLNQGGSEAITLPATDSEGKEMKFTILTQPAHGALSGIAPNVTYTPAASYNGNDSFNFIANDGVLDSVIATVSLYVYPTIEYSFLLNDTGIRYGGNYPSGSNNGCSGESISEQDCSHGRDVTHNDNSDGHVGFSFTKLDSNGHDLSASALEWSCVRDNVTGLVWEVKIGRNNVYGDEGLHDADDRFNWYNTNPMTNGGAKGYEDDDGAICYGYDVNNPASYCNTQAYVARVNSVGLCGASDWRMPSKMELANLVDFDRIGPSIDMAYFPGTRTNDYYWSASPSALHSGMAWHVYFGGGDSYTHDHSYDNYIRLVRFGQ